MPSLARRSPVDHGRQRVRGHDWDKGKGGPIKWLRRVIPLVVR